MYELHRPRGLCVPLDDLAGCRIEYGNRRRVAGCAIDNIPNGGDPPLNLHGHLFVADVDRVPIGKHDPPEDNAVVGVPSHEGLFARQRRVLGGAQVLDSKQTPVRGDHAVDRRHGKVGSLPLGLAQPLIPPGRTDDGVLSNGVVVRAAKVLLPLIGARQLGLDGRRPFAVPPDHRGAEGSKHSHEFARRNRTGILAHDQRRQVVHVGEFLAVPVHDRHRAVCSELTDGRAGRFNAPGVRLQSLNDTIICQAQRRSELPVPATDVDHQAAMEVGRRGNLLGLIRRARQGSRGRRRKQDAKNRDNPQ